MFEMITYSTAIISSLLSYCYQTAQSSLAIELRGTEISDGRIADAAAAVTPRRHATSVYGVVVASDSSAVSIVTSLNRRPWHYAW